MAVLVGVCVGLCVCVIQQVWMITRDHQLLLSSKELCSLCYGDCHVTVTSKLLLVVNLSVEL